MNASHPSLSHHSAPYRERVSVMESAFGLLGGPFAWFLQLCTGYALASWPCFPKDEPRLLPIEAFAWTGAAVVIVSAGAFVLAVTALLVSWRVFQRTRNESAGNHVRVLEVGAGRTRFLALWGMVAGGGFAAAIAFTAVALSVLPRCAG